MTALRRVFAYAFHGGPIPKVTSCRITRLITGPFEMGDLKVTPFALPHGHIMTNGSLFEQGGRKRLAYFSDCKEVTGRSGACGARRGSRGAGCVAARSASDSHVSRRGAHGGAAHRRGANLLHASHA